MNTLIALHNIHKSYGSGDTAVHVLRGITLNIDAGDSLAIVGASGSGKSTLLHIMGALDSPGDGTLRIDGQDPATLPEKELAVLRNRKIGFVFQNHYLLPQLTVMENVLVPVLASGAPKREDHERAQALLHDVGLAHRKGHRPGQLSGGECQRVAVVRALINSPAILLADEPTGSLDAQHADSLADLIFGLQKQRDLTLVLVTHSPELAGRAARHLRMHEGQLVPASTASR